MFNWLKTIRSSSKPARVSDRQGLLFRFLRGRYDAATTTDENRRHWASADGLSADVANSPQIRRTLRNRSRYEVANNSYARGIVLTLANDLVGTGPRLRAGLPWLSSRPPRPPPNGEADPIEPMDAIELEQRMLMTMPGGWKMAQVHAEQPATTYAEFKNQILN